MEKRDDELAYGKDEVDGCGMLRLSHSEFKDHVTGSALKRRRLTKKGLNGFL